jgi:CheY-like chemotaxis protein
MISFDMTEPYNDIKILLVDDSDITRNITTRLLRLWGYTCYEAKNGLEAVEILRTHAFDLVLMDLQMPIMNGYDATKAIRALSLVAQPQIFAMTATTIDEKEHHTILSAGMDGYLTKPLEFEALSRVLGHDISTNQEGKFLVMEKLGVDATFFETMLYDFRLSSTRHFEQLNQQIAMEDFGDALQTLHRLRGEITVFNGESLLELLEVMAIMLKREVDGDLRVYLKLLRAGLNELYDSFA